MSENTVSYRLGNAVITRIVETQFPLAFNTLYPAALEDMDEAVARRKLPVDFTAAQEITLSVHSWLIDMDGLKILIDTGIGNHKPRPFSALFHQLENPFLQRLAAAGAAPEDIDYVLLTHLHTDHVGWNTRWVDGAWQPTFPKAKYVLPRTELEYFFTPAGEKRRMLFDDSILPVICTNQAVVMAADGGEILPGIAFHPAPGHSAGHMIISLRSGGHEAIFSGDAMHSPLQVARPEWGSTYCLDLRTALASRLALLEQAAQNNALILPAHFPGASAGYVMREGDGYAWRYAQTPAKLK
ncbi:MBL fold metallo-hydrolase [Sodalis ligni]|uniref:Glyoxylase-like metal-dependent hydrolase (Beta-lactamase superfamily II) n=1 Tax=Sodalis ligni TaxID=2697027 RepID=A0A4R1NIW1_9GAMM|nr:MBL fold metallo-hydrolase [Sodalis ligni]TCL05851.1 glyoxylase-like metal-dependent hydrolase (beta-lactamase superfamily II) [Sodalis ligni]